MAISRRRAQSTQQSGMTLTRSRLAPLFGAILWTCGLLAPLSPSLAQAQAPAATTQPPAAAGHRVEHWIGTIYLPNPACPQITFVTTFRQSTPNGPWGATLSITPGCSVRGLMPTEMTEVVYTNETIRFVSPPPPSENLYDLKMDADGQAARGQLLLGRQQGVLVRMRRATEAEALNAAPRRPQTPAAPFPYDTRPVTFTNPGDAVTLGGVVTIPRENPPSPGAAAAGPGKKHAAVVLVSDENPQDLDQTEGFHKSGLVLADWLTRQGVVVLRFDERGLGASGGACQSQTLLDAAIDVRAAADLLATLPEVDPSRIGVLGRGEGATLAAIAAAENPRIGFVVLMAPAATSWKNVLVKREQGVLEAQGEDASFIASRIERYTKLLDLAASGTDPDTLKDALRSDIVQRGNSQRLGGPMNQFQISDLADSQVEYLTVPRVVSSLNLDPKPYLEKLCCPVLTLIGDLDMHTPPKATLPGVEAALTTCPGARPTITRFARTNHWFQPCNTGFDDEYDKIEITISPQVLQTISEWIETSTGQHRNADTAKP